MKAIRIHKFNGPDALSYEDVALAEPGEGQVRVKIEAVGVNYTDIYQRSGLYPGQLPASMGQEAAGVVDSVGPGITDVQVGERVAYISQPGAYPDFAVVAASDLVPIPDGVETQTAAAVMLQGMTAHYLAVTLDVPEPTPHEPLGGTLGVDLGIINLATDSEGETFSGEQVEKTRQRMHSLRQRLQKRGTKSAKRHLKKLSGREARFRKDVNHRISKCIVQKAQTHRQGIAIEELRHIRQRTERTVKHSQRARHSSWSFWQLRFFLSYKAALAGVPLHTVDPAYTSRTCSGCGHCEKANRKSQASFVCQSCGHAENADRNAAINISRAVVMQPIVSLGSRSGYTQVGA